MNDFKFSVRSNIDRSVQTARCKHCKFFNIEFDRLDRVSDFGYCSAFDDRRPRIRFACDKFVSKPPFTSLSKVVQLKLFDND